MKLTLNPYTLVVESNGEYVFTLSGSFEPLKLVLNDSQKKWLEYIHSGNFSEYDDLCAVFSKNAVDKMVSSGCLLPIMLDTQSMNSRTNAFFLTYGMPQARANLNAKSVLILGCGGIGTHMAWHMSAMGIGKLTLVDFDTVEESNFNRQILFDCEDVGKIKTDVLKDKLCAINKNIEIKTINIKISSEQDLEWICTAEKYDLIIKSLDSPKEFPFWLESVCKRHSIAYISGITLRDNVLIGPTFIPGKSVTGWSELMNLSNDKSRKIYGTAPSIGIMLYYISSELAIEAFKILTGYGNIKYSDKILFKNLFTQEEHYLKNSHIKTNPDDKNMNAGNNSKTSLIINIILMILISIAGISNHWFLLVAFIASTALPFLIYKTRSNIVKCTFVNSAICSLGFIIGLLPNLDISTPISFITTMFLLFGIYSVSILIICSINFIISKAVKY